MVLTVTMTPVKRGRADEEELVVRKVKQRANLDSLIVANMEPIQLVLCWTPEYQREFRQTQLYPFLRWSMKLPPIDVELVEEYVRNYRVTHGISKVRSRRIEINQMLL